MTSPFVAGWPVLLLHCQLHACWDELDSSQSEGGEDSIARLSASAKQAVNSLDASHSTVRDASGIGQILSRPIQKRSRCLHLAHGDHSHSRSLGCQGVLCGAAD